MDTMMMMETNPLEFIGFTAVTSAIALALAIGIVVGVTFDLYGSPLSYSFAGILSAGAFGFGLTPWAVLGANMHLDLPLNVALLVLGLIIVALTIRIHHLMAGKHIATLPVAKYLPAEEVQRRVDALLSDQGPALYVS